MTKVPAGKIENGRIARSFFEPTFHADESLLISRVLEDFNESHEKVQDGIRRHATTSITRGGIIRVLRKIEHLTDSELSFFTDKYPLLNDATSPRLPYPALVKPSNGSVFQAKFLLTALLDADHVSEYFKNRGDLTYPTVKIFGHEALDAFNTIKKA